METLESLGNLPMVRCKTCNRPIGKVYQRFIKERQEFQDLDDRTGEKPFKTPSERAFDSMNITNKCCRANLQNPPRIPIGGYFYEPQVIPNTYIIGEHGYNFGDPTVMKFLHTNAVDENKRQILASGITPIYKRVVSTSNIRYGKKFTPTLLDLCHKLVEDYINLSIKEQDNTIKALWEVFLSAMYIRGWKGPGFGYPVQGTGPKVPRVLNTLLINFLRYLEDENVIGYPNMLALKREITILPDHDKYIRMLNALVESDEPTLLDIILEISPEYSNITGITSKEIKDYVYLYFKQASELVGSLLADVADINKSSEHMEMYYSYLESSIGITKLMSQVQAINFYMGQPVRQNYTLNTLLASDENTFNTSRIIALTAYYTLNVLTGKTIQNFDPKAMTGDESGIIFQEIPVQFVEFKN
jgi:DNA-directed RNA polymerase subunit N (RpoN/RPB10)